MNFKIKVAIFFMLTSGFAQAAEESGVSIQDVSRAYVEAQKAFTEAQNIKSIERLLKTLTKADESIQAARIQIQAHKVPDEVEPRIKKRLTQMKKRLTEKLLEDAEFLRDLKSDLGLAESDSIESYRNLRRSLLQDPEQKKYVIKMDLQILLTMEKKSLTKSKITTR